MLIQINVSSLLSGTSPAIRSKHPLSKVSVSEEHEEIKQALWNRMMLTEKYRQPAYKHCNPPL